tara:strand:+ start:4829 stop:5218 length:390 start_codon:yes stop_codon:yes gene_type:complete
MPNFISTSELLKKKYEEKKENIVKAAPTPVSDVCSSCWFQSLCIVRTITRRPPRTCCIYEFFGARGNNEATVEEMVSFTCDTKCVERQQWVGDPCPHNEEYCENHCPVSRYIKGQGPSNYMDVPAEDYG